MTPDNPVHEPKPAHQRPGPEVEIAEISQEVRGSVVGVVYVGIFWFRSDSDG